MKIDAAVPEQLGEVARRDARPADARQAARHGAERRDAVRREVEALARADRADDGEQRPRHGLRDPRTEDEERQHARRDEHRVDVRGPDLAERAGQLRQRAALLAGHPEHAGDLLARDLDADARQEADEDGPRQEVGEEAQAREPREQEHRRGEDREHARERDVLRGPGGRQAGEARGHDRRGRRIGADDEVPRGPEERERQERQEDRVEAGDHRHPGDLRVPHDLRDGERRERGAREHLRRAGGRGPAAGPPGTAGTFTTRRPQRRPGPARGGAGRALSECLAAASTGLRSKTTCLTVPVNAYGALSSYSRSTTRP